MGERKPNVLLLVVDACRADYVYGDGAETPAIASLADDGTGFRRAVSAAPWTLPSVTSLLTGLYPHEHGATSRGFETDRETITRQLSAAGYRTLHVSPKTWIGDWLPQGGGFDRVEEFTGPLHRYFADGADVRRLSEGVARGPEWYATVVRRALADDAPLRSLGNAAAFKLSEATGDVWRDDVRASERAAAAADRWFERFAEGDDPFFAYIHLMDPHLPFYVPETFRSDVRPPGCDSDEEERAYVEALMDDVWAVRTGERRLSPDERDYLLTRYADELAYADAVIGEILDSLDRHGHREDTLVALVGDHGEHLGETVDGRTLVDHQTSVRMPVVRPPMILRYPGVFDGGERSDVVGTHYLADTVRALAGLDYDRSRSLLSRDRDATPDAVLSEYDGVVRSHPPDDVAKRDGDRLFAARRTAVAGEWKLDVVDGDRRPFRVDWDANEQRAVDDLPAAARERLVAALPDDAGGVADDRTVPADVERRLGDLGYL